MKKTNILIIMVDQLSGLFFPDGPCDWLHVPNLKALARRSARFSNAYTASPLCTPARGAFMSGLLPSGTGIYDNAAEFPSCVPTYAHHLRLAGYYTCLSGKMHFIGADQLHGFEERLTTDIYPADFGWVPDYQNPAERVDWWYHNLGSVANAGVAEITNQLEYDDEVANCAVQKLYQLSRGLDERPWCLTVSFTHPHDPYVARRRFWDMYSACEYLLPAESAYPFSDHDPHSQRIMQANDYRNYEIGEEHIRRARRAYFANISYLDEKIGELLQVLRKTRQWDNTAILFTSDHGDMLGEKGLWYKMSFFEASARIPLMICAPDMPGKLISEPVSIIDIVPTLAEIAGVAFEEIMPWVEGESLLSVSQGNPREKPVRMEFAAETSCAPLVSVRQGRWKYNRCLADPDQLFDLQTDPREITNLAKNPRYARRLESLKSQCDSYWNLREFDEKVRASQQCRKRVIQALRKGHYSAWDFQPRQLASERFMRNHLDLNQVEYNHRYPRDESC